jgi:hypothetical protein
MDTILKHESPSVEAEDTLGLPSGSDHPKIAQVIERVTGCQKNGSPIGRASGREDAGSSAIQG